MYLTYPCTNDRIFGTVDDTKFLLCLTHFGLNPVFHPNCTTFVPLSNFEWKTKFDKQVNLVLKKSIEKMRNSNESNGHFYELWQESFTEGLE